MNVRERFSPKPMAADSTLNISGQVLGGFLAKTSGTISIVSTDATGLSNVTLVDAIPVTAGVYTPIPIMVPATGYTVTLAGGASGTLLV
jgi:hypothetical protein